MPRIYGGYNEAYRHTFQYSHGGGTVVSVSSAAGFSFSPPSASSWVGIPYPTDLVPTEVMPTLPTTNNMEVKWSFDPLTIATPTWTDASNQYYVDPSHGSANDANNGGRGSPTLPRATIPGLSFGGVGSWALSPGDQVFIVGDGNTYGTTQDIEAFTMLGTSGSPIWIIGVYSTTKPLFNLRRYFCEDGNMSYTFWDGLHFGSTNDFRGSFAGIQNVVWRNNLFTGSGVESLASRRFISFVGESNLINRNNVVYNNVMHSLGLWNPGYGVSDCLGVHVQRYTHHTWILNNEIYNIQGDSVMTGNSGYWTFTHAYRPHYTYVGGNNFHDNYENAYDCKDSYHNIISSNWFHDFAIFGTEPAANDTAVIMGQDSEGYLSGYTWVINNLIEDAGIGVRCEATSEGYRGYIIGNVILNMLDDGVALNPRNYTYPGGSTTTADYAGAINNTIVNCGIGFNNERGGVDAEVEFSGNVVIDCTGNGGTYVNDIWFEDYGNTRTYKDNIVYKTSGSVSVRLDGTLTTSNNTNDVNPNLSVSYVPNAGSVCLNYVPVEHVCYALFQSMYGIDIREDRNGLSRPQQTYMSSGALERAV